MKVKSSPQAKICPHCNKMFFAEAQTANQVNIDLDRHAIITLADGREFPVLSSAIFAGVTGAFTMFTGFVLSNMFPVSPSAVLLAGSVSALAGCVVPVAMALHNPDRELPIADQLEPKLDRFDNNTWFKLPDVPGNFTRNDFIKYTQACLDGQTSEKALARDMRIVSQPQHKALVDWAITARLMYRDGGFTTAPVKLTAVGRRYFTKIAQGDF